MIYTAASWWHQCTGNSTAFGSSNPLWVAHYGVDSPNLPAGWGFHTFWQYTSTGSVPGVSGNVDRNVFNGDESRLLALANNTSSRGAFGESRDSPKAPPRRDKSLAPAGTLGGVLACRD